VGNFFQFILNSNLQL